MIVLITSLICAISAVLLMLNRFLRRGYDIEFTFENAVIVPIVSSKKHINNNTAICFYSLTIVNKNAFSSTIRSVEAFARIGKSWHETTLYDIRTGKLENGIDAVILSNGQENIVMMRWKNLRGQIQLHNVLPNGGVLKGSVVFVLDADMNKARDIGKVKILISDYLKNRSTKYVRIQERMFDAMNENFKIVDRAFTQTNSKVFEWEHE